MPSLVISRATPIERTPRVLQVEGLFEVQPAPESRVEWSATLPLEDRAWRIGLIVGPSGCGKTTLARELFGAAFLQGYDWPQDRSIVDAFPEGLGIKDITGALSSVGFSSPPSWLRPFRVLSNGEQFRATLARALVDERELVAVDEFTSVVDRTVAKIGSCAVAKAVRSRDGKRLVAVSCHYDVADWLQPDWVFDPSSGAFEWRLLQRRPPIQLSIDRVHRSAWRMFKHHHYMSTEIHKAAKCFIASVDGRPAAFTAVLSFQHATRPGWREHRTVCLPDFQGVGIGNALSEFVAGMFLATGKPYFSTTASPAMIRHRARSSAWRMGHKPALQARHRGAGVNVGRTIGGASTRVVAGFEFVGTSRPEDARRLGVT